VVAHAVLCVRLAQRVDENEIGLESANLAVELRLKRDDGVDGIRAVNVIAAVTLIAAIWWASSLPDSMHYQVTGWIFVTFAVVMFALWWTRRR
jgi:hypothetical protein